ncbi:MAG: hypothetical protein K2R98_23850 [Gemmataceae bacterium]|nr:hypothetical protein [Gemmataceae bacterium]
MSRSRLACLFLATTLLGGCQKPAVVVVQTTGPGGTKPEYVGDGPKLEIDPALTADGITITEKSRDAQKIVLLIRSTKKDRDSSTFYYFLYNPDGKELEKRGFSVPAAKQNEDTECDMMNEDFPKASRMVIRYFAK